MGCSASSDDAAASSEAISEGLHEPQGAERAAILTAFREVLAVDLNGQDFAFNSTNPVGRFVAHDDWASYEGILEGANGNTTPIDFTNTTYQQAAANGYLDGVTRNGHFAAKLQGMAHRDADGTWHVVDQNGGKSYALGAGYEAWRSWASLPPIADRDVSREFPKDDLHEPQGAERTAILRALHAVVDPELHGQTNLFDSNDPPGVFLEHDGWAYYDGIIEGPNENRSPIDYQNSEYRERSGQPGFEGVLRNGNFAARLHALLVRRPDGSWTVSAQDVPAGPGAQVQHSKGYAVGTAYAYFGEVSSFAYDIYGGGAPE